MNKQTIATLLSKAFNWWVTGLLACLPDKIQQIAKQKPLIQCTIDNNSITFQALDRSGMSIDKLSLDLSSKQANNTLIQWLQPYQNYNVMVLLNPQQYLLRPLTLPAQAKDTIEQILQFEIERQTPFTVDQVHIGYQFNAAPDSHSIALLLAVVPKDTIAMLAHYLANTSLKINSLSLGEGANNIKIVLAKTTTPPAAVTRLNYGLAGLATILTVALLYKPIIYYDNALAELQMPLASVKQHISEVRRLQTDNAQLIEHKQFLANKLADYRSRLAVINELTLLLPQHTWLSQSTIQGTVLTIQGESAAASDLIALLDDSSYLSQVRFAAPTTINERSAKARFKIQAMIEPAMQ